MIELKKSIIYMCAKIQLFIEEHSTFIHKNISLKINY